MTRDRRTPPPVAPSGSKVAAGPALSPKAVFLDVDGTLVNDRGLVPATARDAVVAARANGHRVFLSTGRSTSELWDEILATGFDGVIAAAGGYVAYGGEVLLHHTVPVDHVRRAMGFFDRHGIEYFLESNRGLYGSRHVKQRMRQLLFGPVRDEDVLAELEKGLGGFIESLRPLPDPLPDDINKISFLDSPVTVERVRSELAGTFHVIPATVPMFGPNSGELSTPGIHKGMAVELLIGHLGIDRTDTIAFGDGLNDIEMVRFAGVGVAMGNAHPDVLAAADRVTAHVDEDGILVGFRELGLI